jgi:hypothetical protein
MKEKKNFWDTKVGNIIKEVAPAAVDILGDTIPGGDLVKGIFKNFVTNKLTDTSENLSTDQLEEISQKSQEFELALIEYESKEREALLIDKADARNLAKTLIQQEDKFTKRFLPWFSIGSVFIGFAYVFGITFFPIPESSQRFADTMLGVVIVMIIGAIYSFWFGSSYGSKVKDWINNKK